MSDDSKIRRMLTCFGGGEYHAETKRDLSPSEMKDIQDTIEGGKGYQVVQRMSELAKLDRRLLTGSAVEVLSICVAAPMTKVAASERQKLRLFTYESLPDICGTPMDLLKFVTLCDKTMEKKGGDMIHKKALQNWYTSKNTWDLAVMLAEYDDVGHKELLKGLNPRKTGSGQLEFQSLLAAINWGTSANSDASRRASVAVPNGGNNRTTADYILGAANLKKAKTAKEAIQLCQEYNFSFTLIPQSLWTAKELWRSLIPTMELDILLRNIPRMAAMKMLSVESYIGATERSYNRPSIGDSSSSWRNSSPNPSRISQPLLGSTGVQAETQEVLNTADLIVDRLAKATVPANSAGTAFELLITLAQYSQAKTAKDYASISSFWSANPKICEALEATYTRAVKDVKPMGKRLLILIDCSPSMDCNRLPSFQLSSRVFLGVLLQFLLDTEGTVDIYSCMHKMSAKFPYTKGWKADAIANHTAKGGYSVLDVTHFVDWATTERHKTDVFLVVSDDGVEFKGAPPHQAMVEYRKATGIPNAKLITLQLTHSTRKISTPEDLNTLDCHGFNYDTIEILRKFITDAV